MCRVIPKSSSSTGVTTSGSPIWKGGYRYVGRPSPWALLQQHDLALQQLLKLVQRARTHGVEAVYEGSVHGHKGLGEQDRDGHQGLARWPRWATRGSWRRPRGRPESTWRHLHNGYSDTLRLLWHRRRRQLLPQCHLLQGATQDQGRRKMLLPPLQSRFSRHRPSA